MADGQLQLALDFLHQSAVWTALALSLQSNGGGPTGDEGAHETEDARGLHRARCGGGGCWNVGVYARQGPGEGLVRLRRDSDHGVSGRRYTHLLRLLGVAPSASDCRSEDAELSKLWHRRVLATRTGHGAVRFDRTDPSVPASSTRVHGGTCGQGAVAGRLRDDGDDGRRRKNARQG